MESEEACVYDTSCTICIEEFSKNKTKEKIKLLSCNHCFHKDCLHLNRQKLYTNQKRQ